MSFANMNNKFSQRMPLRRRTKKNKILFDLILNSKIQHYTKCSADGAESITEVKISAFHDKYPYKILSPKCIIPICGESF